MFHGVAAQDHIRVLERAKTTTKNTESLIGKVVWHFETICTAWASQKKKKKTFNIAIAHQSHHHFLANHQWAICPVTADRSDRGPQHQPGAALLHGQNVFRRRHPNHPAPSPPSELRTATWGHGAMGIPGDSSGVLGSGRSKKLL